MLKTKKLMTAVCAALIGFAFVGCEGSFSIKPNKGEPEVTPEEDSGVDYTDYGTNYSIAVKNESTKNMVLFLGEPKADNLMGGVKAGATSHLKKNADLFTNTTDFVVFVITEDDYVANKDSLASLAGSPYTTFYAVYNKDASNENIYRISGSLAGKYKIIVNNPTKYNVELRNMGPEGETIGFSLSQSYEKAFHSGQGEYMIFPVFRKFDKNSSEILSTYPTYSTGKLAGQAKSFEFSLDEETTEVQFNTSKWVTGVKFTPSASYIKIINSTEQGLQFFVSENATPYMTAAGGKRINPGKELVFPIMMQKTTSNEYETSKTVAGYRCGTNRIDDIYLNGDQKTTETYKAGYMYTYTISGSADDEYIVTPLMEEVGTTQTIVKEDAYVDDEGVEHPAVTEEVEVKTSVLKATPVDWSSF